LTPNDLAFQSDSLQVWFNDNPSDAWKDPGPHLHTDSDEMFIVLEGALHVAVDGNVVRIAPGEFCCFPVKGKGRAHRERAGGRAAGAFGHGRRQAATLVLHL